MRSKPAAPDPRPSDAERAPLLVDVHEAARLLGISARKLWSLAAGGDLPTVRIGARRLFDVHDLERFVERAKAGAR